MSGPKSVHEHGRLDRGDDRFQRESKAPVTSVEWLAGTGEVRQAGGRGRWRSGAVMSRPCPPVAGCRTLLCAELRRLGWVGRVS